MLIDIRIKSELPRHRKFKRLKRLIGPEAMEHLITLWCNIAEQTPNGELNGWSNEDISDASGWGGNHDVFVDALIDSGFLDRTECGFRPHDWHEHQPWVIDAKLRSEKAKKAGKASALARLEKYGTAQPPNKNPNTSSAVVGTKPELSPNPRTPSPSPNIDKPKKSGRSQEDQKFYFKTKTACPDDFYPTDSLTALAVEKGFTGDLKELVEEMKDHHIKKGSKFNDWVAAARAWLRTHKKWHPEDFAVEPTYVNISGLEYEEPDVDIDEECFA